MTEGVLFREMVRIAQQALIERLDGRPGRDPRGLVAQLFATGRTCGLTEKAVAQVLLEPLKTHLRTETRKP